jgi:leucyl/phenylalanyl-tRNA--protein transferase
MPVFRIPEEHIFPHPSLAEEDGLLGVGGDLNPSRLLLGYANGIFPWYSAGQPIFWFSPDPRYVLYPAEIHVGRSLRKRIRREDYEIRLDTAFADVIRACRQKQRPGQRGTWITDDMEAAYNTLHEMGYAHSAEAWRDGELVGGLYGVGLGNLFSGESMFTHASDASKIAFVWLTRQLQRWGTEVIDCQIHTAHLERFGAQELSRQHYLELLQTIIHAPTRPGPWRFDDGFSPL